MTGIRWGEPRNVDVVSTSMLSSVIIELPIAYRTNGEDAEGLFRYALTLAKEGEQWRICSGIASVPYAAGTYSFSDQ
jgi:hypothetical protein